MSIDRPTEDRIERPSGEAELPSVSGRRTAETPRHAPGSPAPLSFVQQRLWVFDQLEPEVPVFHRPSRLRLRGLLRVEILEQALTEIARRHEPLRTIIAEENGVPFQIVLAPEPLRLRCEDISRVSEVEKESRLQEWEREDDRRFDLSRGPLFRVRLVRFGELDHLLLWNVHHIVFDAWSMSVLRREIEVLYEAFAAGNPSPLPEPTIRYSEFARQQRESLRGPVLEGQLAYWRQKLSGVPDLFDLPFDRPRPARESYRGAAEDLELGPAATADFEALTRGEGATVFMASLAAFEVLLARYSGREDFAIGIPIAGRRQLETEDLIGCFINTLVIRADLSGDPTLRQLLKRVRKTALEAYAYQDVPFEKIVEEIQPSRALNHSTLFQVMLNFRNLPRRDPRPRGLMIEEEPGPVRIAMVDLALELSAGERGLAIRLVYNTDLFDASRIRGMAEHFRMLIRGAVENPDLPIGDLSVLTAGDHDRAVWEWNQTVRDYPVDRAFHELFEDQVARVPDHPAVSIEGEVLTYAQLNARADGLARRLRREGIGPEVPVGVCFDSSAEMLVALLGVWKAGGAWVALDPAWPRDRLAFVARDSGCAILLTGADTVEAVSSLELRCLRVGSETEADKNETENLGLSGDGARLAYILYTSGSTGEPKGVAVEHRSVVNYLLWVNETLLAGRPLLMPFVSKLSFDASLKQLFAPLLRGDPVWILPEKVASHPDALRRALSSTGPVALNCIPTLWSAILGGLGQAPAGGSLSNLKALFLGGERLPPELVADTFAALPHVEIWNLYGPTEATANATAARVPSATDVSIGRPIANARAYVLDSRKRPLPAGTPGELFIGGDGVARGYWRREELTKERFLVDPFRDGSGHRMYRTGDLVRQRPDGNLEFLGRLDHQVKIRGYRIEIGEIEMVLSRHPSLEACAVVMRQRELAPTAGGLEDKRLVAYVVAREGASASITQLRGFLKNTLPDYMIPSAFVFLDSLPVLPSGKVDRAALPATEQTRPELEEAFVAPRNAIEETIAGIWRRVLGLEKVGVCDNFFELGGDSILAIQIIARAAQEGLRLTPRQLFKRQTVAELAAVAEGLGSVETEQGPVKGPVALTPIQHWFFEGDLLDPHHFNQSMFLEAREPLDREALEEALQALMTHHDALRLRFVRDGDTWRQSNAASESGRVFSVIRQDDLDETGQSIAIEEAAAKAQASLRLSEGPIVKAVLFDLGPWKPARLLLIVHHLAVDGVSWRILLEDLERAYLQIRGGHAVALPPKTTSFRDWVEKLTELAASGALEGETRYWRSRANKSSALLPLDGKGENTVGSAESVVSALSEVETKGLLQEVPAVYRTQINDVLLTALATAFEGWTGSRSLVLDLEGHGREEVVPGIDLSHTVGWFTARFPVLLELPESEGPGERLVAIKEQLRAIPRWGIGYGILRYLASSEEAADRWKALPEPAVSFNYLGQFDSVLPAGSLWRLLRSTGPSTGPTRSPRDWRRSLIAVKGEVLGGCLRFEWVYGGNLHRRAAIERLAASFERALRDLLAHCRTPEAGGYTPSDFPKARLSPKDLDKLVAQIKTVDREPRQ